jgi:hypothetical protein
MTDGADSKPGALPVYQTPFALSLVRPRSFLWRSELETASSRPGSLCLPRSLLNLFVEELDHRFVGIKRPMQTAPLNILPTLG